MTQYWSNTQNKFIQWIKLSLYPPFFLDLKRNIKKLEPFDNPNLFYGKHPHASERLLYIYLDVFDIVGFFICFLDNLKNYVDIELKKELWIKRWIKSIQ